MERYNVFTRVHKGLRAFLFETAMTVQQTDFSVTEEAEAVMGRIGEALYYFNQHSLYIERLLFPYIIDHNPGLIAIFRQQYQSNVVQAQRLRGVMNAFGHAANQQEQVAAGHPILKAYTGFLITQLDSMAREDNLLNAVLWRYYTDEELMALEKEIVTKMSPRDLATLSKWVIRGMNNAEIIEWLRTIERCSVASVFISFFSSAEQELPEERWQKIQEALAEGSSITEQGVSLGE
ncbi:hypothetical protein [Paraflavitalea sp. CAU 1676]|uniref:hypothetical protein n=1 Tax=Paraflavitalea sp. CAU 1676 TaxID=3032598 RepID=UPI0023DCAC92|nr:hypothetical protein [Paraflavitalea sp. CAU 1676]MDF2188568.1 hypothetical protein [Paraflavitalea sp. CAU 1676]